MNQESIGRRTATAIEKAGAIKVSPSSITEPIIKRILLEGRKSLTPIPGRIYTFSYNAKYKDTLPYWDANPVILVIGLAENGFIGLNFHYLPFEYRIRCLMTLDPQTAPNDLKKLQFRWEAIRKTAISRLSEQTVKRYLKPFLRSPLIEVHPRDWYLVMALPLARFRKATEEQVGSLSIRNSKI